MHKISLKEAETCLAELVKEATNGEEVIITQTDGSVLNSWHFRPNNQFQNSAVQKGLLKCRMILTNLWKISRIMPREVASRHAHVSLVYQWGCQSQCRCQTTNRKSRE